MHWKLEKKKVCGATGLECRKAPRRCRTNIAPDARRRMHVEVVKAKSLVAIVVFNLFWKKYALGAAYFIGSVNVAQSPLFSITCRALETLKRTPRLASPIRNGSALCVRCVRSRLDSLFCGASIVGASGLTCPASRDFSNEQPPRHLSNATVLCECRAYTVHAGLLEE